MSHPPRTVAGMELGSYSEDRLDQLIAGGEREIATIRLLQMAAIVEKRRRRSHLADGCRSIVDWMAARADVSHETARSLCWTASRLAEAPDVVEQLAAGEVSFDRAKQLSRLPSEARAGHEGYDISGLRRLVADHKRLTRNRERRTGNGFVHFGHSDELATTFWGELPGLDARIMEKAVDQRADEIVPGDQRLAVAERRALALVAICQDSLYQSGSGEESPPVDVAVIVDAPNGGGNQRRTWCFRPCRSETGTGHPRRGPLQRECGPDRSRRAQTARFGTPIPDCGPETQTSCPPP